MDSRTLQASHVQGSDRWANLRNDVLELPPERFGQLDIALLNLLCAPSLPGSESIDIDKCLARLDHLAGFVKTGIERNLHRQPNDPDFGTCEPKWRMAMLITILQRDYGAAYDPAVSDELARTGDSPFVDSRNVFIHGLLDDDRNRRWGSCASIPVLVVAIAQRLGYPVKLAINRRHVYCRWEDSNGLAFNIEACTLGGGFAIPDDVHYRDDFGAPPTDKEIASNLYFRSLEPHEAFAHFLRTRAAHLHDIARYEETLLWSARALQFSPDHPYFSGKAYEWAELGIKHRFRRKFPDRPIPPPEHNDEFFYQPGEFLRIEERSLFLTIVAHYHEYLGQIDKARTHYEESARQNFHGHNEQRDLQRFLSKHNLSSQIPFRQWHTKSGQPRRVRLPNCPPNAEVPTLHRLADRFDREGNLLMARDTLHDLYLFNPCDADVFRRARDIENRPEFQSQLKAVIAQRRNALANRSQSTHQPNIIQ